MYLSLMDRVLVAVAAVMAAVALVVVLVHDVQRTPASAPVRPGGVQQPLHDDPILPLTEGAATVVDTRY